MNNAEAKRLPVGEFYQADLSARLEFVEGSIQSLKIGTNERTRERPVVIGWGNLPDIWYGQAFRGESSSK